MEKNFITRDMLADFVEQMWDAGITVDLKPSTSSITLWSDDRSKLEFVDVVSKTQYKELVRGIKCNLLPIDDGINTCSQEV